MKSCRIVSDVFIGIFLIMLTSTFLWAGGPGDLVMKTVDGGITILKDPSLNGKEKMGERKQKLWEELSPIFNFGEMSKRALGKHWNERSDEEKQEFVELFTSVLKDSYIGKTDTYSGEKVVYLRERQAGTGSKVQTKFVTKTGKEISVDFNLLNKHGKWKVYDVIIEGVSLVNNWRKQFYDALVRSSYEDMIQKMKKKKGKESVN
jgi:phospholipid transport system substrate-binding protein